jgi:UDP-N-acetylmuramyl pentapeptide phosphotransferase/UDP-N-acetylglucosamine-1-phosphate transferase
MRTYVDSTNRAAVRWGGGLGIVLVVVGLALRPVAIGGAVIAFLAALMCLGVAAYAWLDDVLEARSLRRRGGRR